MSKINVLIIKKRAILFCLIFILTFLMNLFLWNETSQLIRQIPNLSSLKAKSNEMIYELNYLPYSDINGKIIPYDSNRREKIYAFLEESFFDIQGNSKLFINKQNYLNSSGTDLENSKLIKITKEVLKEQIEKTEINPMFINDILVFNINQDIVEKLENQGRKLGFPLEILSLKARFELEYNYYMGNFLFGVLFSFIFLSFALAIAYWIVTSSLKIFQQEIRLLRIVGLSNRELIKNYTTMVIIPPLISMLVFWGVVYLSEVGLLLIDYVYLLFLNLGVNIFIHFIIKNKIRRMFDA